jgi:biopolymer transport protein ExbB
MIRPEQAQQGDAMRGKKMIRKATAAATASAALLAAKPVFAQGSGEGATVFEQFFLSSTTLGLIVTWMLILMSVSVVALILRHMLENRSANLLPRETIRQYEEMLQNKRFREAIQQASEDRTVFGQIIHASLSEAANGFGAMERAIEEQADLLGAKRVRSIELLNVLGAVGPMLGLFGTVYGMIAAFQEIVNVGGQPDPAQLAGGISTALVTTFWGLIVGIPAVAAAALLRNKIDGLMVEAMVQAEALISPLSPANRKSSSSSSSSGSGGSGGGGEPKPKPSS